MTTVASLLSWPQTLDVRVYLIGGPLAVIVGVLVPLAHRQGKHQAREDAAVDRWRSGGSGE